MIGELKRSGSKTIQPLSPGEILLRIVKESQNLFTSQGITNSTVSDYLRKSLRLFTGASWVEVFFQEDSKLCLYKSLQAIKSVPIDNTSLPGLVASTQEAYSINNASASSSYSSFEIKFHPFVMPSKETVQASSVACIPIMKEGSCRLVLLLFNKLDESNSLSFFTENDFATIEALGLWAVTCLDMSSYCADMAKKLQNVKEQNNKGLKLMSLGIEEVHRKNELESCSKVLESESKLTRNSIQQILQTMMCQGVIFHIYSEESLKPIIAVGMDTYDQKILTTKTAEFSLLSLKGMLNVNDLSSEPLWDQEKSVRMMSLLACPIFNNENSPIGCIEFFKKTSQFSPVDELYAKKITEILSSIPSQNFIPSISKRGSIDTALGSIYKQVNSFALSTEEMYDFPKVFAEIRESIRELVMIDSCSVYIADQVNNAFWTRQSENCDVLTQPIFKDTLFGYVYANHSTIILPSEIPVSDISSYDKFGIIQPVLSSLTLNPVIGILAVFRSHKAFTKEDTEVLEKLSLTVAKLFESLWIYRKDAKQARADQTEPSPVQSPDIRFRIANSKSSASIHYLSSEVDKISNTPEAKVFSKSSSLYSLSGISNARLGEIKLMLHEMKAKPDQAVSILAKRLRQLVPCQNSKIFILDTHEQHIIDLATSNLAKPSGLVNFCMQSKEPICVKSAAWQSPHFDKHIDSLGGESTVESFLAIPIVAKERALGVIAFANASINFDAEDIAVAEFISNIPKDYLSANNENIKDINNALQLSRRHKMLQQWCKQVFFVANSAQSKIVLVKDILHKLYEETNFEKLIKAGLEMLAAIVNAEQSGLIIEEDGELIEYQFKKNKLAKKSHLEDEALIIKALDSARPISLENSYGRENILLVPYVEKNMQKLVIKCCNKRDDSLSYYCSFNKEDEQTLAEFSISMSNSFMANEQGESPEKIKEFIKNYASNLNTHSLISTIRTASQKLLDCDRATVFIIEGKEMVVKAQGMEKEIPEDFRIPIGKGIIGNVAQSGQTENIKDVYEDPRFDPAMDKKTGYRTSTMLCMPVLDTQGKVIAALQMINKKKGFFDESDEETLVLFSEIISSALQNCSLFMYIITERSRILNILNSIGNYIIVLNSEGFMAYTNKSIKNIFGVSKKNACKNHYSSWLRENRELVLDITSVLQNPAKKLSKKAKKLVSTPFKRARSTPNITRALQQTSVKESYFNYSVVSAQSFNKTETTGVVLILEDASEVAEMSMKLERMQSQVDSIKSSIYGETSLEKCIQKLAIVSKGIEDDETKAYLEEVIKTLKQGNLNSADIMKQMPTLQGYSSQAISEYIGINQEASVNSPNPRKVTRCSVEVLGLSMLSDLRDINLNPFAIEDHHLYVKAMFQDFELLGEMEIDSPTLANFTNQVREHYQFRDNPFHNFYHGFNVLHGTYMLLATTKAGTFFSAYDIFALLVASFCHDLEHPGRNNTFEINRGSLLALIYNDKSVLENHHAAVTFKILQAENSNLIAKLTPELKKSFRKLVITAILGTDMSKHVEVTTSMASRFKDMNENPLGSKDIDGLSSLLLHGADLSHPCTELSNYERWSAKVNEEYSKQYEDEISLGLPLTEIFKDLSKKEVYYANEFGFLKFVIKPLWDCINLWLHPHIDQYIDYLNDNINTFQRLKEENPKR